MLSDSLTNTASRDSKQIIVTGGADSRPLQNPPFCPISTLGSNFNPQNTLCIPAVKIFVFLELEQK
jgi:hypothetical protein